MIEDYGLVLGIIENNLSIKVIGQCHTCCSKTGQLF